jgi:glutamyl-tRNA synthetase
MTIVRVAPAPSGAMHIGTCRTAYFNWLEARANKGIFILRIDDTNQDKIDSKWTQLILDSLEWLGILPDKIFYQSKRIGLYQAEAKGLLSKNKAKELENGAIALRYPNSMPKSFMDNISGNISITETNKEQIHERLILLRGGENLGNPTYQFASAIDDYFMDITNVIRGVDHITNTPKQIAVWCALNEIYGPVMCPKAYPQWTHLGLIYKDKKKLSKRDNAASLIWYKDQGYTPEMILNFILKLGWAHKDGEYDKKYPLITKEHAIEVFHQGTLKNSACNYDQMKLEWYKRKYEAKK